VKWPAGGHAAIELDHGEVAGDDEPEGIENAEDDCRMDPE